MQSSSPEQQAGRDNRSARRRLIRGAFGAPAALTLYSGGALAATSMTCVARRVAQPVSPTSNITTTANSDMYVRVQLYAKNNGADRSTWVSAVALLQAASLSTAQANVLPTGLPIDGWYCVSAGNNGTNNSGYTANTAYSSAAMLLINNVTPAPVANSYIAMRVDANGKIVGFTDAANASVVSRSCWTSFAKTI